MGGRMSETRGAGFTGGHFGGTSERVSMGDAGFGIHVRAKCAPRGGG